MGVDEGMSERQRDAQAATRGQGESIKKTHRGQGVATNEHSV